MTKVEFLNALEAKLSQLPRDELEKNLSYYSELIDDMTEDGMSDTEAVDELGDISAIADSILSEIPLPVLVRSRVRPAGGWSVLSIILMILGCPVWIPLLFAALAVILSIYIVIWSVIIVLFAVVLAIAVCALAALFFAVWGASRGIAVILVLVGCGAICAGLAIPAFYGALAAAKLLIRATVSLARWIKSLFIRKEPKI